MTKIKKLEVMVKGACVEGYSMEHRVQNSAYVVNPDYKYFCCDSRDCSYKKEIKNKQYCIAHLRDIHY